ncbi:MAG: sensory protein TspO [Flavobacterium sp. MedPE-SWcel]|uniref:TspO/MBR family protein n=1 Tax=uncultured Flavobacterium sp. TaxID=165435 RepID=UPI0009159AE1|nr:TspO/MBR family protein [uncultured Flavobacterium sp.]OIQ17614.1 MAG: sensory protein TspO [Flavobacterium sp. MedPE-SWcel]
MSKTVKIIILVIICLAVGYLSSLVTRDSVATWYITIQKPIFNPPNWLFAPVWTLLYILMGIAAGLIWSEIDTKKEVIKKALLFFAIQLALNALWSYLFFGLHNPLLALIEILILWVMMYKTFSLFSKINKIAGYLFIPYILWVSFAILLNAAIWWLN